MTIYLRQVVKDLCFIKVIKIGGGVIIIRSSSDRIRHCSKTIYLKACRYARQAFFLPKNENLMQVQDLNITKTKLKCISKKMLADTHTPVSIYMKIRDVFSSSVLLESTDFRSKENCFSFIGMDPIASIKAQKSKLQLQFPNNASQQIKLDYPGQLSAIFEDFIASFDIESKEAPAINGLFGHCSFESIQYFDSIKFDETKVDLDVPDFHYSLYRFVIAINHFKDEMYLIENLPNGEQSGLERLETLINNNSFGQYQFKTQGKETSNMTDQHFMDMVTKGKEHCYRGDVFQIVVARRFQQSFTGDDFNVYRTLRSINPSPYLFYFDYGNYKIFGSSPEAQLVIKDNIAEVHPIAGTYRRTGNDEADQEKARELAADPKENAEHIMLVDLARNDLGRHAQEVQVKELKEIQYFSHVIHLVSKVQGKLEKDYNPVQVFGDSFPAGTLSGAPKYKAIQLIADYEPNARTFYGGAIGHIGFDGTLNTAIVIRSFLSKDNTLYYQAGAGIVASSQEESELNEVNNKLAALKKALFEAEKI